MMEYIREHRKLSIIILLSLVLLLFLGVTFSRYIFDHINNYILETKGFYFNSDTLSIDNRKYKINNWDGVNSYTLTIDVNNRKNTYKSTTADINYDIAVNCPATVTCTTSKTSGVIYKDSHTDSYILTVTPNSSFAAGDEAIVTTSVTSTSPYVKSMSATYTIGVTINSFSYSIDDSVGSKIMTLKLLNSIPYYKVESAFDNYNVGDKISLDTYNALSTDNKAKCFSSKVSLSFNPSNLLLDMTDVTYKNRIANTLSTTTINGYTYVTGYTFKMEAQGAQNIIFYKNNINANYTYPITNPSSIVTVTVESAS